MVALIGGSIHQAMPVAMIAGSVVALGAVATARKHAAEPA